MTSVQEVQAPRKRQRAKGFFTVCSGEWNGKFPDVIPVPDLHTARSTSAIFRGSSCADTGCRWCGISC